MHAAGNEGKPNPTHCIEKKKTFFFYEHLAFLMPLLKCSILHVKPEKINGFLKRKIKP